MLGFRITVRTTDQTQREIVRIHAKDALIHPSIQISVVNQAKENKENRKKVEKQILYYI